MTADLHGAAKESTDVEPIGRNKVERDAMYTPNEKKRLKPDKKSQDMYAVNNNESKKVVDRLIDLARELQPCDLTADSLYDSILYQVSHKKDRYKSFHLRKQIAYFLVKYPEVFHALTKKHTSETEESYESFVWNIFHGLSFPKLDITTAVLAKMWNVRITLVTPRGLYRMFHNVKPKQSDIVIVWNGLTGLESQFTATKVSNPQWRPLKGLDWAGDVKLLVNVKNASSLAEKFYRKRTAQVVLDEYNEVTDSILNMKEQLVTMNDEVNAFQEQIDSMKQKITTWAANVYKMEGRQGVLRLRLMELGVNINKLAESGSVVPGFQDFLPPENLPPAKKRKPTSTEPNPETEQLGAPPDFTSENAVQVNAEVHQASGLDLEQALEEPETPQSTTVDAYTEESFSVLKVVTPDLSIVKTIPGDTPRQQHPMWSTPNTAQPSVSSSTTQPVVSSQQQQQLVRQLAAAGVQQVQLPAQAATFQTSRGEVSVRWGKTLKGVHKFWCFRCQEPFTTKNDCTRHEQENCKQLDKSQKRKYKCDICQVEKSSKQYLREHMAEEHTKQFIYHCKGCNKGFYKHTALNHHKKACLSYMVPDTSFG